MKKIFRLFKTYKKLSLMHFIQTDKNLYFVYNVQPKGKSCVYVSIEKNDIPILSDLIEEESLETFGGTSFNTIVMRCISHLRKYVIEKGEVIMDDRIIKNP
jgi:hypothetical protein